MNSQTITRTEMIGQFYLTLADPSIESVAAFARCSTRTVYRHLALYRCAHNLTRREFHALRGNAGAGQSSGVAKIGLTDPPKVVHPEVSHKPAWAAKIDWSLIEQFPKQDLKPAIVDIETSDFTATGYVGYLLCCSILPLSEEWPHTHSIQFGENGGEDTRLMKEVIADLSQYDILIGHYIAGFDLPWLYTRADVLGLPALRRWEMVDTYWMARSQRLKTDRKSQAFLLDHFGLEPLKTSIYPRAWNNIRSGCQEIYQKAHDLIVEHCEMDVVANRRLFDRLLPKAWSFGQQFKYTTWAGVPAPPTS